MPVIDKTIKKLPDFAKLAKGWHFGDGGPVQREMIQRAELFLLRAKDFGIEKANAFPGLDGSIELTFYRGQNTIAFVLETDGNYSITEESECDIISDDYDKPYAVAENKLREISLEIAPTSDLLNWHIGIPTTKGSETAHSNPAQRSEIPMRGFPQSERNAFWEESSVNTQGISTAYRLAIP